MSWGFDVETLGHESNTVVLSAAIIYVDFETDFTYQELIDRAIFVKFNVKEQIQAGRTTNQDTLDWWKEQSKETKVKSLLPSDNDVSVADGLKTLRDAYSHYNKDMVWIRGALDSMAIDSLANTFNEKPIAPWWNYRDVRTAIDITKETSVRAYCTVPDFDKNIVIKHDPVHDVAYDIMQLRFGV